MSSPSKTPSLLANAHSVASVGPAGTSFASRSVSKLVQAAALSVCFAATALAAAPAAAQSYHPADQYQVSTADTLHATVVRIQKYNDRNADLPSEFERRQATAARQAVRRTSNLLGSIVSAAVGDAIGGNDRYSRSVGNIGGQYAGQIARGVVENSGTRVNADGWSGNVRLMPQSLSLVTLDVHYPGNRVDRIQIRQPQAMSEGLSRGDQVTIQFTVDPRTNQQMMVAVETPASQVRSRPRR